MSDSPFSALFDPLSYRGWQEEEESSWWADIEDDSLPTLGRSVLSAPAQVKPISVRDHRVYLATGTPSFPELPEDRRRALLWPNVPVTRVRPVAPRRRPFPYRDSYSHVPVVREDVPGLWMHADDLADGGQSDKYGRAGGRALHRRHFPDAYADIEARRSTAGGSQVEARPSPGRYLLRLPKERTWTLDNLGRCMQADRSREARELWALERAADRILRDAGEVLYHLDVIDRKDRLPVVAPDPAAYRGPVRVVIPRRVRYEHRRETFTVGGNVAFATSADPTGDECHDAWADAMLGRGVTVTLHATLLPDRGVRYFGGSGGRGWYGRKVGTVRAERSAPNAVRADAVRVAPQGGGRTATLVTAVARSIRRYIDRAPGDVQLAAQRIAAVLKSAERGARVPLTAGASILVVNAREAVLTLPADLHSQVIRDATSAIAQRAALLGLSV